ncbi:MAG: hypothetical protein ACAH83_03440 [Alphaproteobacteria bacterium]
MKSNSSSASAGVSRIVGLNKKRYHTSFRMRVIVLFLALLSLSAPAHAGDFMLTICNGPVDSRTRAAPWQHLRTTQEVIADLQLYAQGGKTNGEFIGGLYHGAIFYCSNRERSLIRAALLQGVIDAKKQRVHDFTDFLMSSGPAQAVSLIDSELAKKDLPRQARERLTKARARILPYAHLKKKA